MISDDEIILDEVWRDVVLDKNIEYYDKYEISNYGRVRNKFTHKFVTRFGSICNPKGEYWLRVNLNYENIGIKFKIAVHRLVALAFIPNPDPVVYVQVNHIDGHPENNYVDNLEWCTSSQNMLHAYRHNLVTINRGSKRSNAIFTEEDIRAICYWMRDGYKANDILYLIYDYGMTYNPNLTRLRINSLMKHLRAGTHWVEIAKEFGIITDEDEQNARDKKERKRAAKEAKRLRNMRLTAFGGFK